MIESQMKEMITQKSFAICLWVQRSAKLHLKGDHIRAKEADLNVDKLILELIEYIKKNG